MYERLSNSVRYAIARSRSMAILGHVTSAIALLEASLLPSEPISIVDKVAVLMAIAEILHWDCEDSRALDIFKTRIDPLLPEVPDSVAVVVGFNRADVSLCLFEPSEFYSFVDHSRVARIELWREGSLLNAQNAAADGKHYVSLPTIWRELHRAYLQGCWSPYRVASTHMAKQCLQLGHPGEAAFHATIARDDKTAESVGEFLVRHTSQEVLEKTITRIIQFGQLQRLFVTASHILSSAADAIPESQVEMVFGWVLERAALCPASFGQRQTMDEAWRLLAAIGFRLNDGQASRLAATAAAHPLWSFLPETPNHVNPVRQAMLNAILQSTPGMSRRTASTVARIVIPLATDRKHPLDYVDSIRTLCNLAERGGPRLKKRLRTELYPKGQRLTYPLLQVSHYFEQPLNKPKELAQDASRVIENLRRQVQQVKENEEPIAHSETLFTISAPVGNGRLVVYMVHLGDVFAILSHRATLPKRAFARLVDAILDMIEEPENVLANKFELVKSLADIGDRCTALTIRRILDVLLPLTRGEIVEPTCTMSAADAANPLNPFKLGSGTPNELRAVSIYTLACLAAAKPALLRASASRSIEEAINDADPLIRRLAIESAREAPTVSSITVTGILLATRDADSKVSNAAFHTIPKLMKRPQNEVLWRMLLQSLQTGSHSLDVRSRRGAAFATARVIPLTKSVRMRRQLQIIQKKLGDDLCFSVRRASRTSD